MYFDAAEQAIADLTAAVQELQAAPSVDFGPIYAELDAIKTATTALQTAVAALDARLDAIAAGAQG